MSAPLGKMMGFQTLVMNSEQPAPLRTEVPEKSIVRNLLVTISGTLTTWQSHGSHGPRWHINPEQAASIFTPDSAIPGPEVNEQLGRALVRKVTMLEANSSLDDVVGVTIDGLPPKEFTRHGDGAAVYLTGKGRVTVPQELFSLSSESDLGVAWMNRFPKHTRHNLEVEGAMHLPGTTYWFVRQDHPVLYFIEQNKDQFGVADTWIEKIQNGWFKVALEMFDYSLKSLRDGILHHAPSTFDLTTLTVRLVRPDRQSWLAIPAHILYSILPDESIASEDSRAMQEAKCAAIDRYLDRPITVTLRLAVEYSLPNTQQTQMVMCDGEDVIMATSSTVMGG